MKKALLIIAIAALLACITGIPVLCEGIVQRGWDGVNYGRILFPLLLSILTFIMYRKRA